MNDDSTEPKYTIGVMANMLGVHQQTLRMYEREGLVKPQRTARNTRLYSDEDYQRLQKIIEYTQVLGVNLAGVEVILKLRERLDELESWVSDFLNKLRDYVEKERMDEVRREVTDLVRVAHRPIVPFDESVDSSSESDGQSGS